MDLLVWRLLSVHGPCHVAKDAPNFSSEWVTVCVSTLIVPLKVPPPKLDKEFVIGGYFGTGTFDCWRVMPSGQGWFNLLLWMGFSQCFLFDCPIESTTSQTWHGICHRWIFWYGDFWVLVGNAMWPKMLPTFALNGFKSVFSFDCPLESTTPKFDKGFIIGGYFGTGTFECWWAMPCGQRCSKLLLWMGLSHCFHFDCPLESTGSQIWQGNCHRWIFWYRDFWVLVGNAKRPKILQNFTLNGFQSLFSLWFPLESTWSQIWQGICRRWIFWYGNFWVLVGNAKWPKILRTFALNGF